jgi:hypothetical protein
MGRATRAAGGYADAVTGNRAPFLWLCGPPGVGMTTPGRDQWGGRGQQGQ